MLKSIARDNSKQQGQGNRNLLAAPGGDSRATDIFVSMPSSQESKNIRFLLQRAWDCYSKGQVDECRSLLNSALELSSEKYGENHRKRLPPLSAMALFETRMNNFDEADRLYRVALKIATNYAENNPFRKLELLEDYATMLKKAGKNAELDDVMRQLQQSHSDSPVAAMMLHHARNLTPSLTLSRLRLVDNEVKLNAGLVDVLQRVALVGLILIIFLLVFLLFR